MTVQLKLNWGLLENTYITPTAYILDSTVNEPFYTEMEKQWDENIDGPPWATIYYNIAPAPH
jgi:hypothetical protein